MSGRLLMPGLFGARGWGVNLRRPLAAFLRPTGVPDALVLADDDDVVAVAAVSAIGSGCDDNLTVRKSVKL